MSFAPGQFRVNTALGRDSCSFIPQSPDASARFNRLTLITFAKILRPCSSMRFREKDRLA